MHWGKVENSRISFPIAIDLMFTLWITLEVTMVPLLISRSVFIRLFFINKLSTVIPTVIPKFYYLIDRSRGSLWRRGSSVDERDFPFLLFSFSFFLWLQL